MQINIVTVKCICCRKSSGQTAQGQELVLSICGNCYTNLSLKKHEKEKLSSEIGKSVRKLIVKFSEDRGSAKNT